MDRYVYVDDADLVHDHDHLDCAACRVLKARAERRAIEFEMWRREML